MEMGKQAIFPGSFDPFTRGHEAVVHGALKLFDKVVIGIGINSGKKYLFSIEQRIEFIKQVFKNHTQNVEVVSYEGLTVDYCKGNQIDFIVRGIRSSRDFQFEFEIANMNRGLNDKIQTVFLASAPEHSAINSTVVREIHRNGGDVSQFLPEGSQLPT